MTGFLLGVIVTIIAFSINNYCKHVLEKIYANNPEITSKLNIPLFALFLYYKMRKNGDL